MLLVATLSANEHYAIRHYSTENGLSQNTVTTILQDRQGFMWFGTWNGLNRFDGYNFTVYHIEQSKSIKVNERIVTLYEDANECLWWMTYDEHFYSMSKERSAIQARSRAEVPPAFFDKMSQTEDLSPRVDANGILWQVNDENGISRCRNKVWKHFEPELDPKYAGQLRRHFIMLQDHQGRTWVNPTGGGFSYYDYQRDTLINPFQGRLTNMIHTAYIDRSGLLWLATYDSGIECIDMSPRPYQLFPCTIDDHSREVRAMILLDDSLYTFTKDEDLVYCAVPTCYGLLLGSKGKGILNQDKEIAFEGVQYSDYDVYDIWEQDRVLYVATYGGGINILTPTSDTEPLTFRSEVILSDCKVRALYMTDHYLWAATTTGLARYDTQDHSLCFWNSNDIRCLYHYDDKIWLGTFGGGLGYISTHSDDDLHSIAGTPKVILSMVGQADQLWLSSEQSITQYNLTTGEQSTFDVLPSSDRATFSEAKALMLNDSTLIFGYSDGYCIFEPNKAQLNNNTPTLRIIHYTSPQQEGLTTPLRLSYEDPVFSVEYAALEYAYPNKIRYAYKLEGLEDTWHEAGQLRYVTYSNLAPGHYIFHVRSTNHDGIWTDNEQTLEIYVAQYPWYSWWAILIYVLLAIGLIILIIYIVRTHVALREEVRIEQRVTDIKLRFFTNISHELRTPLTLITGPVENILQSERLSPSVRSQLELVQSNGQRMLRLVNQLLDFRKIQNQKMRLKVQRTLLGPLTEEVTQNFNKEAYDQHIDLRYECRTNDTEVWVDRARMDSILYNLLSNAFKFTPAGKSIRVIIDEKPDYLLLIVSDEGVGIPMDRRSFLFERFSSHDEIHSPSDKPGTGIGLNLVKDLVDLHKGFIEVESEVGKGTTFTIMLHRGTDHFDQDVDIIVDDESPSAPEKQKKQLNDILQQASAQKDVNHILIVDDNEDMRQFLTSILSAHYSITTASDGMQALAAIQDKLPNLIISDLMMPIMDGLELTNKLKSSPDTSFIPIILLTAKSAIQSRLQAMQYGADDYVTKPFEPEYLKVRVENILTNHAKLEKSYRDRLMKFEPKKLDEQEPNDAFLAKLLNFIEQQMDNNELTVEEVVEYMGMGRTVFFNRLKGLTGLSPVEFIREIRIKRAAQLLELGTYNITEVTYMVGMNDSRYFSKCFKNTFGMTPSEYRHAKTKKA